MDITDPRLLERLARALSALVMAVAVAAITGWIFDLDLPRQVLPGLPFMTFTTALLLLAGVVGNTPLPRTVQLTAGSGAVVLAILVELEYRLDQSLGLGHLFVDGASADPLAGRPSEWTALAAGAIGLAVVAPYRWRRVRQALAATVAAVSGLVLAVYLTGSENLYSFRPISSMAVHTAASLFALSVVVFIRTPGSFVHSMHSGDDPGSVLGRRALPVLTLGPIFLAIAVGRGVEFGWYSAQFGHLALAMLLTVGSATLTVSLASRLGMAHRRQQQLLDDLTRTNTELEERVAERTERLAYLADHDPLTGLLNRRGFDLALNQHRLAVSRYGAQGALLMVDLDNFKWVNDFYGHSTGDEVIRITGNVLAQRLRASDIVGRLGGDEFAVLVPVGDIEDGRLVAEAVVDAVRSADFSSAGPDIALTASVGVVDFGPSCGACDPLVAADAAMYAAKRAGRDRWSEDASECAGADHTSSMGTQFLRTPPD